MTPFSTNIKLQTSQQSSRSSPGLRFHITAFFLDKVDFLRGEEAETYNGTCDKSLAKNKCERQVFRLPSVSESITFTWFKRLIRFQRGWRRVLPHTLVPQKHVIQR